jgi:GNAT superfamily N-acetyltransferase
MEYFQMDTKHGKVIIRDAELGDLPGLIPIYKKVFSKHNIFQKTEGEILVYLEESHEKNQAQGGGYLTATLEGKVIGGLLMRKQGEDPVGKHVLLRLNHVAIDPEYTKQKIGSRLLEAVDKKIKAMFEQKICKTAKIELGISENEKDVLPFFERNSYVVEGKLASHYRWKETAYVLGREVE